MYRGLQRDVVVVDQKRPHIRVQLGGMGAGKGGVSANEYSCAHHETWSPNKLWRSTSIFNLCLCRSLINCSFRKEIRSTLIRHAFAHSTHLLLTPSPDKIHIGVTMVSALCKEDIPSTFYHKTSLNISLKLWFSPYTNRACPALFKFGIVYSTNIL